MKACLRIFMAILVSLMLSTVVLADDDDDDSKFNLRSLKGAWGFIATGTVDGIPATGVGPITFDGSENCTFTPWFNLGGVVIPLTTEGGTCLYDVNGDGTGTIDLQFVDSPLGDLHFFVRFVIVDDENELRLIVEDPTQVTVTVASGVAKKQ